MTDEQRDIQRKLSVPQHAEKVGNARKACRHFGIGRSSIYRLRHAFIKRGTPQLKVKVEQSDRSDQQEFYQLLSYKGDVDLEAMLDKWERFFAVRQAVLRR